MYIYIIYIIYTLYTSMIFFIYIYNMHNAKNDISKNEIYFLKSYILVSSKPSKTQNNIIFEYI